MGYASKDALFGASDIRERDVHLPSLDLTVKVRSLPAAYSNEAQSEATTISTDARGRATVDTDTAKLEALQVLHGLVEPRLDSIEEATRLSECWGAAWHKVVDAIRELSGIDEEAVEQTNARFPDGGQGATGSARDGAAVSGNGGSDLHMPVGA